MLTILGSRDSRKIRNPRFAPELLERKLSPSGLVGNLAPVAVVSYLSNDPLPLPPPPPPPPVPLPVPAPTGPVGPA